ncbi:MAG: DUF6325 family protein [Candidatus Saccharibacteria bacterium]
MRGPIDFIIVEFDGNNFRGEIIQELEIAVRNKVIDVLDMAMVSKDSDGNVEAIELSNLDSDLIRVIKASKDSGTGLITDEDVAEVGDVLKNNCSAGLLIIEQLWAKGLKKAIIDTGGRLISEGRIHPDATKELNGKEEE